MIDLYGRWHEEADYSHYPKEKWCFMDYMAVWIRKQGYEIKTDIENVIDLAEMHYRNEVEDSGVSYVAGVEWDEFFHTCSNEEWAADVQAFIRDSGGLREFDYYC